MLLQKKPLHAHIIGATAMAPFGPLSLCTVIAWRKITTQDPAALNTAGSLQEHFSADLGR